MPDEELQVKEENKFTIQRGKHDRENPFVMISKKLLRDISISPRSKGALCYLLSLPDNWKTHPTQVAKALGIGRDQMHSILDELLKNGYATKVKSKVEKGRFSNIIYEFFEEKLPENERFKEKSTMTGNPSTVNPSTEKPTLKKKENKEDIDIDILTPPIPPQVSVVQVLDKSNEIDLIDLPQDNKKKPKAPIEFSPEVKELSNNIVIALHNANPHWLIPKNMYAIMLQIHEMITKENRNPQDIFDVFIWAACDHFWMDKLCKPNPAKYLREQFGQLAGKMNAKPAPKDRKFAPSSNDDEALRIMKEMSARAIT